MARRWIRLIPGVAFLVFVFGLLEFATRTAAINPAAVPPPSAAAETFGTIVVSGHVWLPLVQTTLLLAAGYAAGCVAGILLGILMGTFEAMYDLFEPLTELLRPIPKPALLPAFMLFLGIGATMKISIVALAAFFPVLINTVQGARSVDPVMTDMARTFGHSRSAIVWKIILPAAAPYIFAGMRVSLGIGLVVVVVAEMLASTGGIGAAMLDSQQLFHVRETYGWLIVLARLGLGLSSCFNWVERRMVFWSTPSIT
jgi:ABC-type nitrate/sulfonate/bicarbonate transport system permease component